MAPLAKTIVVALVTSAAIACGSQPQGSVPTAPQQPVPLSFSGFWELEYRVTRCASGRPWHCPATGGVEPISVRLEQTGGTVSGYILTKRGYAPISGPIAGGVAHVTGHSTTEARGHNLGLPNLEVRTMTLSLPSEAELRGSFELVSAQIPVWMAITGEITTTTRHSPLPQIADYAGTWRGWYISRRCVSDRLTSCSGLEREGSSETFHLVIDGATKTLRLGTKPTFVLTGTLDSGRLDLRSEALLNHSERLTITHFNAVRNRVGQLQGTFTYVLLRTLPDGGMETRTAEFELVDVVQSPDAQ